MTNEKLQELFLDLSLEEKIGELFQFPPTFLENGKLTGPAMEMGIAEEDVRLGGSVLSIIGAEKIRAIQEDHIKNHPHHIPMMFMADIINGYRTVFPIPLAQGCSFDPEMTERCAAVAAKESAAAGIQVTFSPMADMVHDARWGRVMESTGEDAYLNGLMAAAMVRGYQGENLTEKGRIAACLKHFAGYGGAEAGRDYNTVELSERTLREDYLPAYLEAVKAGVAMVMTSFNTLNRIPSSGNKWLMRDVLRGEMGFDGVVISDWAAIQEMIPHGIARDNEEAAVLAMNAGVDIDMCTPVYIKNLKNLIESGKVSQALLDEAVLRILELKNQLGLFENPYKDASVEDEASVILCPEHRALAREAAGKSFVLLKNEGGILPLSKQEKVAFVGPYCDFRALKGAWSIFGDDADCVTIEEGVKAIAENVCFHHGCHVLAPDLDLPTFGGPAVKDDDYVIDPQAAIAAAKAADKVVVCLGEHRDQSGECTSRTNLTISAEQMELLRSVCAVNENVVVVLFNGRPLDLREISDCAKAILEVWFPGVEAGNAIARTLYGEAAPSGRLSMSFPYCVGQVPVYYKHMNTGRPLPQDYKGLKGFSQYLDAPNAPLYPFGYGLTYTEFAYSGVTLSSDTMTKDAPLTASVTVTNTGSREGTELVQLYIRDLYASVARPVKELKGFRKVTLAPGESAEVVFTVTEEMLRFYDINMNFVSEPGEFDLFIGKDSAVREKVRFELK